MRTRRFFSISAGFFPSASPIFGQMRIKCVSTGIVGSFQTTFKITFAVFRPTPGSVINFSLSCGTIPPKSETSFCESAIIFFDFTEKSPIGRIKSTIRDCPSESIFCGVSAISKSVRVFSFTLLSVACAERTVETKSVYGFFQTSSHFGAGFCFSNRSKTVQISSEERNSIQKLYTKNRRLNVVETGFRQAQSPFFDG